MTGDIAIPSLDSHLPEICLCLLPVNISCIYGLSTFHLVSSVMMTGDIADPFPRWSSTRDLSMLITCKYILKPSSNRTPDIFTLVQKVKHRVYKTNAF